MSSPKKQHEILEKAYFETAKPVSRTDGNQNSFFSKSDRSVKSNKSDRSDRSDKSDKSDRSVKSNKSDRSDKSDKSDRSVKSNKSDKSNAKMNRAALGTFLTGSMGADTAEIKAKKAAEYSLYIDKEAAKSSKSDKLNNSDRSAKSSKYDGSAKSIRKSIESFSNAGTVESFISGLNSFMGHKKAAEDSKAKAARSATFSKYDTLAARSAASVNANFARSAFFTNRSNRVYRSGINYRKHRSVGRISNFTISKEDLKPFNLMSFLGVKKQTWHERQMETGMLKKLGREKTHIY